VHSRLGNGSGGNDENTPRLFAYWTEGAAGLQWPPPDDQLDDRRITHDVAGFRDHLPVNSGSEKQYVDQKVLPGEAPEAFWYWLAPKETDLAGYADHICVGFVINPDGPSGSPEAEMPLCDDIDRQGAERRPRYNNNVAQINLITDRGSSSPKGDDDRGVFQYQFPVWNNTGHFTYMRAYVDHDLMADGWVASYSPDNWVGISTSRCRASRHQRCGVLYQGVGRQQ
jgi:hypothetical protein